MYTGLIAILSLLTIQCASGYIRVSVMLPLNTVSNQGQLTDPQGLYQNLQQLKSGGVDGIMTDVWWGIVEQSPQQYNWSAYLQLANMVKQVGLHMQVVMSFHQCGTNTGDQCYITLPQWVLNVGNSNPAIFYTDREGGIDKEYLSLGCDNQTIFEGRSPLQIYEDYMRSFASTFSSFIPDIINQVQVGLGPAGEMRYPSYQLQDNKWQYCGIGEFQCYDQYMLDDLQAAANAIGQPQWGHGGPDDAGTYDSIPSQTGFFSDGTQDNYASEYGQFFLGWYSQKLLDHGAAILSRASNIFSPLGLPIAAKVSGIHWWYNTDNHAAEVTAGYLNTDQNNAYYQIAQLFSQYQVDFDFTCLEMVDSQNSCGSAPQELVKQTILAAQQAGIQYAGENALPLCDPSCYEGGFQEILTESTQYGPISRFTYLRLDGNLLSNGNWQIFTNFVQNMHNA